MDCEMDDPKMPKNGTEITTKKTIRPKRSGYMRITIEPAIALMELFNQAKVTGIFGSQEDFKKEMTIEEAREVLAKNTYVGFYRGRVICVEFARPLLFLDSYDRHQGIGKARKILMKLEEDQWEEM